MENGLVSIVYYFSSWSLDETCTGIASVGTCTPRDFLFGSGPLFPTPFPTPFSYPFSDFFSSQVLRICSFCFGGVCKILNLLCPALFNLAACLVPSKILGNL